MHDFTICVLKGQTNHTLALCAQCTRCKAGLVVTFLLGNRMGFNLWLLDPLHNCAMQSSFIWNARENKFLSFPYDLKLPSLRYVTLCPSNPKYELRTLPSIKPTIFYLWSIIIVGPMSFERVQTKWRTMKWTLGPLVWPNSSAFSLALKDLANVRKLSQTVQWTDKGIKWI